MKKTMTHFVPLLLLVAFSCDEHQNTESAKDYAKIQMLKEMYAASFRHASGHLGEFIKIDKENKKVFFERKELMKSTLENLNGKYFTTENFDYLRLADSFSAVELTREKSGARVNTDFSSFSEGQLNLAYPFMDILYEIEDLSLVSTKVSDFNALVSNSALTDNEKLGLYSLGAAADETANFIAYGGGVQIVYEDVLPYYGEISGRSKACSVDMKSVWRGAVMGFFAGGASGAIAGCAGGTVVLPVVGTVTGCVGGAVFGAAGGFTGGALLAIIEEVVFKCVLG
jgi:hypothetical protein